MTVLKALTFEGQVDGTTATAALLGVSTAAALTYNTSAAIHGDGGVRVSTTNASRATQLISAFALPSPLRLWTSAYFEIVTAHTGLYGHVIGLSTTSATPQLALRLGPAASGSQFLLVGQSATVTTVDDVVTGNPYTWTVGQRYRIDIVAIQDSGNPLSFFSTARLWEVDAAGAHPEQWVAASIPTSAFMSAVPAAFMLGHSSGGWALNVDSWRMGTSLDTDPTAWPPDFLPQMMGSGNLSALATQITVGPRAVALSGGSAKVFTGIKLSASALYTGLGVLGAVGTPAILGTSDDTATGTLTSAVYYRSAPTEGTGNLSAVGTPLEGAAGSIDLDGSGELTRGLRVPGLMVTLTKTAAGTTSSTGEPSLTAASDCTGDGTLTAVGSGTQEFFGDGALSGTGEAIATGVPEAIATVAHDGDSRLDAQGALVLEQYVDLAGEGALGTEATSALADVVDLVGEGATQAEPQALSTTEHVDLDTEGTLLAVGIKGQGELVPMAGEGQLDTAAEAVEVSGQADFAADSQGETAGTPGLTAESATSSDGGLNAQADLVTFMTTTEVASIGQLAGQVVRDIEISISGLRKAWLAADTHTGWSGATPRFTWTASPVRTSWSARSKAP